MSGGPVFNKEGVVIGINTNGTSEILRSVQYPDHLPNSDNLFDQSKQCHKIPACNFDPSVYKFTCAVTVDGNFSEWKVVGFGRLNDSDHNTLYELSAELLNH